MKTRRAEEEKKTKDAGEEGKEETKEKTNEDEKEKGGSSVDAEERQRHLAAKRESLFRSLRGLLKAERGAPRREATKKPGDRLKKKVATAISKKSAVKAFRDTTEVKQKEGEKAEGKLSGQKKEVKKEELKSTTTDEKEGGQSNKDEMKNERKIIGKIVKAGHGTKVQVKTIMGGTMGGADEEEEEKKKEKARREEEAKKNGSDSEKREHTNTPQKKSDTATTESGETSQAESKPEEEEEKTSAEEDSKAASDSSDGGKVEQQKSSTMTLTDSTLHRIHGDIRISLKSDHPDIGKCVRALDQLGMVYVTSKHVQRHSELVSTLRKLRYYRANQAIMDKASMLYNRFKNTFLVGEGEEVVSASFLRSLLEEKEREEAQRAERCREQLVRDELLQEVKRLMVQVKGRRRTDGGEVEATGGEEAQLTDAPVDSS
ncbi:PC4 and SFRS1-interacting protein CLL-associated antigen KW-7 Dense fine speckles 70 kDa protein [Larimichthys crocea]|uniref:PC4 and SFRS1-interacting protein CLL-associated antigen KW-7 Dense fine speckles 70 kDa protein n=1 Tax=Larimichthys crocea TaxID=215358 RepID=A0A6G0HKG5_LARCR|nr:PC4 and SFRS1-interacting protein CLL-associated antigen KW-7 Dense fine speckles 70 kDa protein [Larimichthys crocea]